VKPGKVFLKFYNVTWHWWLMPIILASQEAETKITVPSQAGEIVHETLSQKNTSHKRAGGVAQSLGPGFKPQYRKKKKKECKTLIFGFVSFLFCFVFETVSSSGAQAGLGLPQPPECWEYRCSPLHPAKPLFLVLISYNCIASYPQNIEASNNKYLFPVSFCGSGI
jgi:hypothetical protein